MATRDDTPPGEPRRPILAGGERLRQNTERPGGGGPKWHPRTFEEAREHLTPQVETLQQAVAETPAALRGARVVFEATVLPNYLANSYFPAELFRQVDLVPVGTRAVTAPYQTQTREPEDRSTKSYLVAGDERSVARVADLLHAETRGAAGAARDALRQFELVHLPSVEEVVRSRPESDAGDLVTWEAVLHPAVDADGELSAHEHESVLDKWADWVQVLGGEVAVDYQRVIRGMTFMPIRLSPEAADAAARFNPLRALRPMPKVRPIPVSPLRVMTTAEQLPAPPPGQRPQSDVRVAIFDGGMDESLPHLAPFADNIEVTPEPADPDFVAHGTMVTGALLYGPLEGGQTLRTPEVGVDHFRVVPAPSPSPWDVDLYWILDRIVDLVSARDYPLVNLSLGPELSVDDQTEPHAWTAKLDELAAQRGVLFLTAVGNNGLLDPAAGLNRLQVPADMVNGLAVGACDRRAPGAPWVRAPYSAVGPGRPGARLQPTGVAFGGVDGQPFRGMVAGGRIGEACGTSFGTPTAGHGLVGLTARLGPALATPDVLRAFAIHFAEPAEDMNCDEVGFGRLLERYDDRWECAPEELTVLYRDTIERDQAIALPFPLPANTVAGRTLDLAWTLVFTAPTNPTDAVDYTLCGLEVAFRPHAGRINFRNPATGRVVELDVHRQEDQVLEQLRAGAIPGALPATKPSERRRNEGLQREEGKWETALHFTKRMRASGLLEPQLTVNYLAREGGLLPTAPPLEFAMLLSIRAPRGVPLYDEARQHYGVLTPLTARIPLRLRP